MSIDASAARLARTAALGRSVERVRAVSAARFGLLQKLGIRTIRDELLAAPSRYVDMTCVGRVGASSVGEEVTLVVEVGEVTVKHPRPRMTLVQLMCHDATGALMVEFWGQPWLANSIKVGSVLLLSGKLGFGGGWRKLSSPMYDVLLEPSEHAGADGAPDQGALRQAMRDRVRMLPVHHLTEGLSAQWARRIASNTIETYGDVCDWWPADLRAARGIMGLSRALRSIHFPHDPGEAEEARRRLAYDEATMLQVALIARRDASLAGVTPYRHVLDGPKARALMDAFAWPLTSDQRGAVEEIRADMASDHSMSRLLLGDVGTGKTAVATCVLATVADTGTQAAMMAPTGVLAGQYADKVGPMLDAIGVRWALLTGATPATERRRLLEDLARGEVTVLFGTHALFSPDVAFRNLSLVIIDEQHRFGVEQRRALRDKGAGADMLVMTATPIPRTLALARYGDLECSYLRQRPVAGAGRMTTIIPKRNRGDAYEAIRLAVAQGRQAYVVCPLVGAPQPKDPADGVDEAWARLADGEDPSDPKAAQTEAEVLARTVFPGLRVGLLTGRMDAGQKMEVLDGFKAGSIDILVSTTVIEVGIDVPNATVMLIEDGERFGLAQLHQLRGRVGRGAHPGTVFICCDAKDGPTEQRMEALRRTDDGFELARVDLKLRREGDIMGARQSGDAALRFCDLSRDIDIMEAARRDAQALLRKDPHLQGDALAPVRLEVLRRYGNVFEEVHGG